MFYILRGCGYFLTLVVIVASDFQVFDRSKYVLIRQAMMICNKLIVCLDPEEKDLDPFEQRYEFLSYVLDFLVKEVFYNERSYEIFALVDITTEEARAICHIDDFDQYVFYKIYELSDDYMKKIMDLGIDVVCKPKLFI